MKKIALTQGKAAILDDDDFEKINQLKRYATKEGNKYYALRRDPKFETTRMRMHRVIIGVTDKNIFVDHINGDTLDNRKINLRCCTLKENCRNRTSLEKRNTSGYRGVSKDKNEWRASIKYNQKKYNLGNYSTPEEAANAYDVKAKELFGEFCGKLNFNNLTK